MDCANSKGRNCWRFRCGSVAGQEDIISRSPSTSDGDAKTMAQQSHVLTRNGKFDGDGFRARHRSHSAGLSIPVLPVLTIKTGARPLNSAGELKGVIGQKTLELHFFAGALRRVEESRQRRVKSGATASTPKSAGGCNRNVRRSPRLLIVRPLLRNADIFWGGAELAT
jgi:hypothetical protein